MSRRKGLMRYRNGRVQREREKQREGSSLNIGGYRWMTEPVIYSSVNYSQKESLMV
jgi:hypothetical protein